MTAEPATVAAVKAPGPATDVLARLRAGAGRVRLALAVELPWLTLLPYAEDADRGLAWVPFRLPSGADGERFAAAIRAERLPVERWSGAADSGGATLALPIVAHYGEEDLMQLPLSVAKAAHFLLGTGEVAPACPVPRRGGEVPPS